MNFHSTLVSYKTSPSLSNVPALQAYIKSIMKSVQKNWACNFDFPEIMLNVVETSLRARKGWNRSHKSMSIVHSCMHGKSYQQIIYETSMHDRASWLAYFLVMKYDQLGILEKPFTISNPYFSLNALKMRNSLQKVQHMYSETLPAVHRCDRVFVSKLYLLVSKAKIRRCLQLH